MEQDFEKRSIEFQDCVKKVCGWGVESKAFGEEFRDKGEISVDGKSVRLLAKKIAGAVYGFEVKFRNRAKKSAAGNSMLFSDGRECDESRFEGDF